MVKKQVKAVDFIRTWEKYAKAANEGECDNPIDVIANELRLSRTTVLQRSSLLRTHSKIPLSKMPKGGRGPRINRAGKLLREFERIKAEVWGEGESLPIECEALDSEAPEYEGLLLV